MKKIEETEQSILGSDWQKLRPTGVIELKTNSGQILFTGELSADELSNLNYNIIQGIPTELKLTIVGQE